MISKTLCSTSFRGTTRYVLEKEGAVRIGGNMAGRNPDELVREFLMSRRLNTRVERACYHLMLSVPTSERSITDEEFAQMGERHFATMAVLSGLKGNQAKVEHKDQRLGDEELKQRVDGFMERELSKYDLFIARHHDTSHSHIHIVASRINSLDGKALPTWKERIHAQRSVRLLETEFDLMRVQSSWEVKQQLERSKQEGLFGTARIQQAVDAAAALQPTMPEFVEKLRGLGVEATISFYKSGRVRGISYAIDLGGSSPDSQRLEIQGNKVERSFNDLHKKLGVSYDPQRDDERILMLMAVKPQRVEPSRIASNESGELCREQAQEIYNSAWKVFQQAQNRGQTQEIAPGVWSFRGKQYAFTYNEQNQHFSLVHRQRGELVHSHAGQLQSAGDIQLEDLELFRRQAQQQRQKPTTPKPRQMEL